MARQQIPVKSQITAQMIELKDIPSTYINEQAAVDSNEVIGKIAKSEIFPGEQILRDKLAKDKELSDGLAFLLQPGKRAVTVPSMTFPVLLASSVPVTGWTYWASLICKPPWVA